MKGNNLMIKIRIMTNRQHTDRRTGRRKATSFHFLKGTSATFEDVMLLVVLMVVVQQSVVVKSLLLDVPLLCPGLLVLLVGSPFPNSTPPPDLGIRNTASCKHRFVAVTKAP